MGLLDGQTVTNYYLDSGSWGKYQFTSLDNIVNQFMVAYVGEDKLISKAKRSDVAFHAQRAIQELSFDTFKSCKSQEIEIPASLTMILPQDYVNYVKLTWSDSAGIEHIIYPTSKTSNPTAINQDPSGDIVSEILENNGFDTDLNSWNSTLNSSNATTNAGNLAYTWNSGGFVDANAGQYAKIYQSSTDILAGHTYRVSYDLTITQGSVQVILIADDGSATEGTYGSGVSRSASGSYTEDITVNTTSTANWVTDMWSSNKNFSFDSRGGGATPPDNFVGTIDNVTCHDLEVTTQAESNTWSNYKSATPSENNNDDYEDDTFWPLDGQRYGLDPQHAQVNGSFYMDCNTGKIHFSSNMSGKTVTLKYISDGLGTDEEMVVHKFAEEAMYKWIAYAILSTRINTPEYIVNRFKKERFAETRKAKLRLSNIKLEEITQILRGKSKQIKH
jgi:hypothetical protein